MEAIDGPDLGSANFRLGLLGSLGPIIDFRNPILAIIDFGKPILAIRASNPSRDFSATRNRIARIALGGLVG